VVSATTTATTTLLNTLIIATTLSTILSTHFVRYYGLPPTSAAVATSAGTNSWCSSKWKWF
jgi:hypothetical protein